MATLVDVVDPGDPRLADYRELRDVALRRRLEVDGGLFVAEGEKVVRRAAAAGHEFRSLLMARRWVQPLGDVLAGTAAPCYVADDALVEQVTGFHVHRGALASVQRRPLPSVPEVLAGASRVVVLEDLNDHTNVGAIFRSAAAFGIDAVVLSPRCVDPLYRRSIKVAMGAVFTLPYARLADRRRGLAEMRAAGFTLLALTPAADAVSLDGLALTPVSKVALLLGAEGDGLSSHWQDEADLRVRIPISDRVDSLNVAAAAAVACYALRGWPAASATGAADPTPAGPSSSA